MERMRVGVSIIKQLSTAFYRRKTMVLEELIANAYDAGASYAKINLAADHIIVADDGSGMSPEELTKFFYISYTEKNKQQIKEIKNKLKRYIIGKFGIGKLSMYQLCRRFKIITWKDGIESESIFDFEEFEKKEFVDEIELNVTTKRTDPRKHGTEIRLEKVRPGTDFNAIMLRRDLANRMFLNPDFRIFVNNVAIASAQDLPFLASYPIDIDLPKVGKVKGEIKMLKNLTKDDVVGIYVRVRGRVINHDPRLVDFSRLNSPMFTARRIWGILDADGLEDSVQSNRSDFIKDDPKYQIFIEWLFETLMEITATFVKTTYNEMRTEQEKDSIPKKMQEDLAARIALTIKQEKSDKKAASELSTKKTGKDTERFDFKKAGRKFELKELGITGPVAEYEEEKGIVAVNTEHPMYKQARKRRCLEYHVMIASIIVIAAKTSSSVKEFLEKYEQLIKSGEIPSKFKKGRS